MRSFDVFLLIFLLNSGICWAQGDEFDAPAETATIAEPDEFENATLPTNSSAKVELDPKCNLPMDPGNGTEEFTRFFYDPNTKTCKEFLFTGFNGNENNFESQLACLTDCYIDVGEADPINEEDVVIIAPRSAEAPPFVTPLDRCVRSLGKTNCDKKRQRYFYSSKWQSCLAFKSCNNDENYATRSECEVNCKPADGSVCGPQQDSVDPIKMGSDCDTTECPKGSSCLQGMIPQCCTESSREDVNFLYEIGCSNEPRQPVDEHNFLPEVAESCEDLNCQSGYKCHELRGLARCCLATKKKNKLHELVAHDTPIEQRGWRSFN